MEMIRHIPPGGNWKNIPEYIPSRRLEKIRKSGGRTTYYGRLSWDKPAYTITTYFNRPGNGTYIHPEQNRLISFREAARIQSFPDAYRFFGPKSALLDQIGNAVPPLLAEVIARAIPGETVADIFAGAGGLSFGFKLAGYTPITALEMNVHSARTYEYNHPEARVIRGDATKEDALEEFTESIIEVVGEGKLDALIGGPPCQGFSTAGWRRANDPRNMLWRAYFEAVERLKPRWFLMENVPGLLSTPAVDDNTGEVTGILVIDVIYSEFQRLGYNIVHFILKAEEFGVPQRRRRLFVLGFRKDEDDIARIVATKLPPKPRINKPISVLEAIDNLPPLGVNDGEEVVLLEQLLPNSPYQKWVQGVIKHDELFINSKLAIPEYIA